MTTDPFTDAARAEAWRRHPDPVDVETGEPVDDWGFEEQGRRDFQAAAEHRISRLEAQTSIRGRAVVMYRERAREAEARIKAVEDVLAAWHVEPGESGLADDLLRALNT